MRLRHANGFTLIELIVTLAVASILIGTGVPAFSNLIADGRQTASYNALVSDLHYARSEAVKRSKTVVVCARAGTDSCASSGNWDGGWLLFVDENGDSTLDSGETIIRNGISLQDEQSLTSAYFSNTLSIAYTSRGGAKSTGTLTLCDDRGAERARAVSVVLSGGVRRAVDTDSDDIVEDIKGSDVSCEET